MLRIKYAGMVREYDGMEEQEILNISKQQRLEQEYSQIKKEIPRHVYIQKVKEITQKYQN